MLNAWVKLSDTKSMKRSETPRKDRKNLYKVQQAKLISGGKVRTVATSGMDGDGVD